MNEKFLDLSKKLFVNSENLTEDQLLDALLKKLKDIPYIPFPVSFATVDIVPYNLKKGLLLGRKPGADKFVIIGGFADPGESREDSAIRELEEETTLSLKNSELFLSFKHFNTLNKLQYLGSFFINDSRYKNSCHKITTNFYAVLVEDKVKVKGSDDLEEVQWFEFDFLEKNYKRLVHEHHHVLIERFFEFINN